MLLQPVGRCQASLLTRILTLREGARALQSLRRGGLSSGELLASDVITLDCSRLQGHVSVFTAGGIPVRNRLCLNFNLLDIGCGLDLFVLYILRLLHPDRLERNVDILHVCNGAVISSFVGPQLPHKTGSKQMRAHFIVRFQLE